MSSFNLPNAVTVGRIAATPVIAALVVSAGWQLRLSAWVLFVVAAVSDYVDGKLARDRNLVTNIGKLLDPLADKLLLLATVLPMYWMTRDTALLSSLPPDGAWAAGSTIGPIVISGTQVAYPFVTPFGMVGLPLWLVGVVIGREVLMTAFRHVAARRGVVIAAITAAKWKTGFQSVWVGAAFFWYFVAAAAVEHGWTGSFWSGFAMLNGLVGVVSMVGAVVLTVYSLVLYVKRYGAEVFGGRPSGAPSSARGH